MAKTEELSSKFYVKWSNNSKKRTRGTIKEILLILVIHNVFIEETFKL